MGHLIPEGCPHTSPPLELHLLFMLVDAVERQSVPMSSTAAISSTVRT